MTKKKLKNTKTHQRRQNRPLKRLFVIAGTMVIALLLGWQIQSYQQAVAAADFASTHQVTQLALFGQVERLTTTTNALVNQISADQYKTLKQQLTQIRNTVQNQQYDVAQIMLADFTSALAAAQQSATRAPTQAAPVSMIAPQQSSPLLANQIPILIYHKPPADFETQLQVLRTKGYTTVKMSQVAAHLHGNNAGWPAKPVAITLDDGFTQEMIAFDLLRKYNMVATFYLIVGHPTLGFCLGLNQDKTAPCADSYLTWDQAKTLVNSGLVEIGDHTMDHLALDLQTEAVQNYQILNAKQELESRLGIKITTFAYPYGSYNATTLNILSTNGFTSAVTTNPSIDQSLSGILTLNRVRDTYSLP